MKQNLIFTVIYCFILLLFGSCSKFKNGQSVPSYIQIDTIGLTYSVSSEIQYKSAKITDAWIYVDDNLVGAFELPAKFPVLSNGKHTIRIYPGVLLNGMNTTREKYPFYTYFENDFTLVEDSVTKIDDVFIEYQPSIAQEGYYYVRFGFKEDFEDANSVFDTMSGSSTVVERFRTNQLSTIPPQGLYAEWVGKISLDRDHDNCQIILRDKYEDIPNISYMSDAYQAVFLEIDYRSNNSFVIGTRTYNGSTSNDNDFFVVHPSESWNKLYLNLTNRILNDQLSSADGFKIYITTTLDSGISSAEIYLDNIRLVHFKK